jgi:60 kDa SS-A/Ro ribonucleoprotein
MSKLNKKPETIKSKIAKHPDLTSNEEGGVAFKANKKTKLMLRVISSLISEDGFYKSGKELDEDLCKSIHKVAEKDPAFILKLALYARTNLYLRTAPMVLLGEFAMSEGRGKVPNARRAVTNTIRRADEINELLAYVIEQNKTRHAFKGKLPMVIKNGVADAFNKFNAYQFSKYNRDTALTFKDAIFLTHPSPKNKEQEHIFAEIVDEKLAPADTWEVALSTKGASKETWTNVIPVMPFMAKIRNCKNFLERGVDVAPIIKTLTNPEAVHNSKQFPYRFFNAYREIEEIPGSDKLQDAINDAMEISVDNIPVFPGITFVASDNSGSMHSGVSGKSKIRLIEIAALFSAIVKKKSEESIISAFGQTFATIPCSSRDSILTNMKKIMNKEVGHSTNAYLAIQYLNDKKIKVDRIVIFSDMQCYNTHGYSESIYSELVKYKHNINPNVYTYSFDLSSYGTLQIPDNESRVCTAGGFSDKVLNFIPKFEQDKVDMLEEIEKIEL